jgi:hypothetical protein
VAPKKRRVRKRKASDEDSVVYEEDDLELSDKDLFEAKLRSQRDDLAPKPDKLASLKAARQRKAREEERKKKLKLGVLVSSDEDDAPPGLSSPQFATHLSDAGSMATDEEDEADKVDEAFVVQDDTDQRIIRDMVPVQFTSTATQTMPWHIRQLIQLFVSQTILPREDWTELNSDFRVARDKVVDVCKTTIDSLVRSQAWKKPFNSASNLPYMDERSIPSQTGCDACSLGGRISKIEVTFSGPRYNPITCALVPTESDDSDDSDSDSDSNDSASEVKKKSRFDPDKQAYRIGSECKRRLDILHPIKREFVVPRGVPADVWNQMRCLGCTRPQLPKCRSAASLQT